MSNRKVRQILRNGGGGATAGELLRIAVAGPTIDARTKTRESPRRNPEMRIKPAHQRLITDVSRLRPHRCAIIITTIRSPQLTESSRSACALTKDIRAIQTKLLKALVWIASSLRPLAMTAALSTRPRATTPPCDFYGLRSLGTRPQATASLTRGNAPPPIHSAYSSIGRGRPIR
jgi:hypothetical protein